MNNVKNTENSNDSLESLFKQLEQSPDDDGIFDRCISLMATLSTLKQKRSIEKLKEVTGVGTTEIRKLIKQEKKGFQIEPLNHLKIVTEHCGNYDENSFVADLGKFFNFSEVNRIWISKEITQEAIHVAEKFPKERLCQTANHYKQIAQLLYNYKLNEGFFRDAPYGVNTPSGFITIKDGKLVTENTTKEHRQTFQLSVDPVQQPTPLFNDLLTTAFASTYEEQRELLLQLIGLSLLGWLPKLQKTVLMYGVGGAGKSVILNIIKALVPKDVTCSISINQWEDEKHLAKLAGKRFNLVPEVGKGSYIPDAIYKTIAAGEQITAREAFGVSFDFIVTAATWFNSNHLMSTRDKSEGFWRRWVVLHFKYAVNEKDKVIDLHEKIINTELSGILKQALDAAERYLKMGKLQSSSAHDEIMKQWRGKANTVEQWLQEVHFGQIDSTQKDKNYYQVVVRSKRQAGTKPALLSELYYHYLDFCRNRNSKPMGQFNFRESLAEIGHTHNSRWIVSSLSLITKE